MPLIVNQGDPVTLLPPRDNQVLQILELDIQSNKRAPVEYQISRHVSSATIMIHKETLLTVVNNLRKWVPKDFISTNPHLEISQLQADQKVLEVVPLASIPNKSKKQTINLKRCRARL